MFFTLQAGPARRKRLTSPVKLPTLIFHYCNCCMLRDSGSFKDWSLCVAGDSETILALKLTTCHEQRDMGNRTIWACIHVLICNAVRVLWVLVICIALSIAYNLCRDVSSNKLSIIQGVRKIMTYSYTSTENKPFFVLCTFILCLYTKTKIICWLTYMYNYIRKSIDTV